MVVNFIGAALGGLIFYGGKYFLLGQLPHWFDALMSTGIAALVAWSVTRSREKKLLVGEK